MKINFDLLGSCVERKCFASFCNFLLEILYGRDKKITFLPNNDLLNFQLKGAVTSQIDREVLRSA